MLTLDLRLSQGPFTLSVVERIEARAVALIGPSGAGKTTLLEAIAGLRTPSRGEIRIGDRVLYSSAAGINLPAHRRHVGYVPQDIALFPHLNVRRNLLYGAPQDRVGSRKRAPARRRAGALPIDRITDMLEIGSLLDRTVQDLSGGERQRAALARALLSGPDLLLLDEPLAAVDVPLRRRIVPYLRRIRTELDVPLIHVSHDLDEARMLADWALELDGGTVVRSGPTSSRRNDVVDL
jgi:molybdate transport system ATP-binding protein